MILVPHTTMGYSLDDLLNCEQGSRLNSELYNSIHTMHIVCVWAVPTIELNVYYVTHVHVHVHSTYM